MASLNVNGLAASLGSSLEDLLLAPDIQPGDAPSYQLCKTIYTYHPLGAKLAESPISMAQSQERRIAIPDSPEERVLEAFRREWRAIEADRMIFNTMTLSRVYGIASVALMIDGAKPADPVDYDALARQKISFNVLDPLNTAGSLVLNQDPNSIDFLKHAAIGVNGIPYHRSRTCVMMNEDPVYLAYTQSAFGYVGRSVYQRCLYPLKSFVSTMVADDMVARKAGLLIAFMKAQGSIIDWVMEKAAGIKRQLLQSGVTNNVLSMDAEEKVESLNLQNIDGALGASRKNILENVASAADMPAKLLNAETFAEGFGEGTEDAKHVARYIDRVRIQMAPLYAFFDKIVQHRAWNRDFYKTIQREFPDAYGDVEYTEAFWRWVNSFSAEWPNLLTEPDSDKIRTDEVKLKAVIALIEVLRTDLDPENKAALIQWAADNVNQNKQLFQSPLLLDYEALLEYVPPVADKPETPAPPFSAHDAVKALDDAVARLPTRAVRKAIAAR